MSEEGQAKDQEQKIDFSVDTNNLYREENITDLKVASIRKMIPVKPDGTKDEGRTELYFGHSQLMSPQGPVPLQAPLPANNLQEAFDVFPQAMKKTLNEMVERVKQMQEQQKQKKEQQEKKEQDDKKE